MRRVLCLYLPWLSLDRLERVDGGSVREPVVVVEEQRGATVVVHANRQAVGLGVRRGMTLAEAGALGPKLAVRRHDAAADRGTLESLAEWASCLSPIVHIEDAHSLFVDVTGCQRLFRGEMNLIRRAVDGLREQGFSAWAALADTPGAAWALAHAHHEGIRVTEPGGTAAALVSLPVWSLRVAHRAVADLAAVGVETVEALLHLPRASLAARFGDGLLLRLDQALGHVVELLTPFRPPPPVTSRTHFEAPIGRGDILCEAVDRLVEKFCGQLTAARSGVRRMGVTFYCDRGGCHTFDVALSQATRSAKRLRSLARARFERFSLPEPVDTVIVWTRQVEPLDDRQHELFDTGEREADGLADLVDRLSVRLGADRVVRPELVSDHQPERAYRYETQKRKNVETQKKDEGIADSSALRTAPGGGRPVRLLVEPVAVTAMAMVPDGPPVRFAWQGRQYEVADSVGPERIETGWWRGRHVQRDYYRVISLCGSGFWLFRDRDSGGWFLHGMFD